MCDPQYIPKSKFKPSEFDLVGQILRILPVKVRFRAKRRLQR